MVLWRHKRPSRTNNKKDVVFIIADWKAEEGSQEIPGVTGKFRRGVQNEAGQKLTEFCQENTVIIVNTLFQQNKRWLCIIYVYYQMVNTEIRLIIFFASDDGEALYSHRDWLWLRSSDLKLTVAHILSPLLQNSNLNWRK